MARPDPGRFAPVWVVLFVALWPIPGIAATVLSLSSLYALWLGFRHRRSGWNELLGWSGVRLTVLLFLAYWLPQLISIPDALDRPLALAKSAGDLRYLPFMLLCAVAVSTPRRRAVTFNGLALIGLVWVLDALLQVALGFSPVFWALDQLKWLSSGHGFCSAEEVAAVDRLSGILGPCNLKFGQTLASLSAFLLFAAGKRSRMAWLLVVLALAAVLALAGSRASWITFGLIALFSGWGLLGGRKLLGLLLLGIGLAAGLTMVSPQLQQRVQRTTMAFHGGADGVNQALSGRSDIWEAALCMIRQHPINGVGTRGFREAWPACNPHPGQLQVWGEGAALHAHQLVLEILTETGVIGLLLWLVGVVLAWRAWRAAGSQLRAQARPAMVALVSTLFPLNTHLAVYSSFWGGLTLMLVGLFAGAIDRNYSDLPADV